MGNQHLYNEAMAKLMDAQICQNEITNCNAELQKMQIAFYNTFNYITRIYLNIRHKYLESHKNKRIKDRDDKLNEAISKALEIIDDEISNNVFPQDSLGLQAVGQVLTYTALQNIELQYSAEVNARLYKITRIVNAKGMNDFRMQLQKFGW